jgi:cytochrome c-type biogenesis protein CcmF
MLPELANFCLILSLCLAMLSITVYATSLRNINIIRPLSLGQGFFILLAFACLAVSFVNNDFSVLYVANNSNSNLPWYFKLTAIWGGHEGSLLLWIVILAFWSLLIAFRSRAWNITFSNAVLTVFSIINAGFLVLLIFLSNPFLRSFPDIPIDGLDLNPLLQDVGMIIHPPILYMGYVGCAVGFAFAIAALIEGKLDQAWAQLVRPWVLASWMFLTLGIALGSWWAYYELGWGGWWFWDPVENASFMPWLTATALIHCLSVAKVRGQLLQITLFLAIVTFALSLLGTFLVRSGSIVSVHAFATDPQRGMFILQFLAITIGGSVLLYILRVAKLSVPITPKVQINSQTAIMLMNSVILLVATGTVLLGTLYPLIYDAIFKTKLSVGYPYFNAVFVPIMLLFFALMLPGTIYNRKFLVFALFAGISAAILFLSLYFGTLSLNALLGLSLGLIILLSCFKAKKISMLLAHLGVAITIIGISITPAYEIEKDVRLHLGDIVQLAQYTVKFAKVDSITGSNFFGQQGTFVVSKSNKIIANLHPEKRVYLVRETTMTETAILPGLLQDIYIALGQELANNTWSVRIYYKPFVRWIWLGAIFMAFGGLLGIITGKKRDILA